MRRRSRPRRADLLRHRRYPDPEASGWQASRAASALGHSGPQRKHGLDNLTPIMWFKIGNRKVEAKRKSNAYYGKPYQPGGIIKSDYEHILMLRKPGGYRTTPMMQRALSMLNRTEMNAWMQPVWNGIPGASLQHGHSAPFP